MERANQSLLLDRLTVTSWETPMKYLTVFAIVAGCAASLSLAAVRVVERPTASGTVGLGTWLTQAEFTDIEVTAGNEVLYRSDFKTEAKDWVPSAGDWKVVAVTYRQSANGENLRSVLRLPALEEATDYTLRLKARKIAGSEGFLIMFHVRDNDVYWLNLGGWADTAHAVEHNRKPVGGRVPGKIETGRWYDIRIELTGPRIKCFLDDAQILDVSD
jgi:hypothetical protein